MVARPAARIFDPTLHLLPWLLQHGLPSKNVTIGGRFAWLGAPAGAGGSLKDQKDASNDRIRKATAACNLAGNTPTAKAALEALKLKEQVAMTLKILAAAASGASIHDCISIAPIPVGVPHGPGLVINGSKTVMINGLPACRMGDEILEAFGPKNFIAMGQFNVLIGDEVSIAGPSLFTSLLDGLNKLVSTASRIAQRIFDIASAISNGPLGLVASAIAGVAHAAYAAAHTLMDRANRGLDRMHQTARTVGKALNDAVGEIGAAVASGDPAEIAGTVGRKVAEAAKAYNEGVDSVMENAKAQARKAIQDERDKLLRGASNIYDKGGPAWDQGMQKLDEMAEDEGLLGAAAREARERAENVARKKRNIEARAGEAYDKAQDARQQAHDGVEQAKATVEAVKQDAEQKLGELTSGIADGIGSALDDDGVHDGHGH